VEEVEVSMKVQVEENLEEEEQEWKILEIMIAVSAEVEP